MAISQDTLQAANSYTENRITQIVGLAFVIVEELPAAENADLNKIYLVQKEDPETELQDSYDEYIVIRTDNTSTWEHLGSVDSITLDNYYTKTQTNGLLDDKVNKPYERIENIYFDSYKTITISNLSTYDTFYRVTNPPAGARPAEWYLILTGKAPINLNQVSKVDISEYDSVQIRYGSGPTPFNTQYKFTNSFVYKKDLTDYYTKTETDSMIGDVQTEVATETSNRVDGDTQTLQSAKSYTDSAYSTEEGYRIDGDIQTLQAAKTYTDNVSTSLYNGVQNQFQQEANYRSAGDRETLQSANNYADNNKQAKLIAGANINIANDGRTISATTGIHLEIVQQLPTEDISTNTFYLVPRQDTEQSNIYNEYIYVNNAWELIGTTAVDLSNYYTKAQINSNYYTMGQVDSLVNATKNPYEIIDTVTISEPQTSIDYTIDTIEYDDILLMCKNIKGTTNANFEIVFYTDKDSENGISVAKTSVLNASTSKNFYFEADRRTEEMYHGELGGWGSTTAHNLYLMPSNPDYTNKITNITIQTNSTNTLNEGVIYIYGKKKF